MIIFKKGERNEIGIIGSVSFTSPLATLFRSFEIEFRKIFRNKKLLKNSSLNMNISIYSSLNQFRKSSISIQNIIQIFTFEIKYLSSKKSFIEPY
jgi:hypothetical protein